MDNPNAGFYHHYILKDIHDVDRRAERYLDLRLNFLNSKCKPFTARLDFLKSKTSKYKEIVQEQVRGIQNSTEIKSIVKDISHLK